MLRTVFQAALVAAILCGTAFPQSPLERAVTLAREKRYRESNQVLQGVPEPADIGQRIAFHRLKAANASGLNDQAAAVREMSLALQLAPGDSNLLIATAMAEFQANRLDDALQHAAKAGEHPTAKAVIGDIQEKRGNFAAAEKAYKEAVALAPGEEQYRVTLGYDLIRHQHFPAAIELLEQSEAAISAVRALADVVGDRPILLWRPGGCRGQPDRRHCGRSERGIGVPVSRPDRLAIVRRRPACGNRASVQMERYSLQRSETQAGARSG